MSLEMMTVLLVLATTAIMRGRLKPIRQSFE
ncbi:hypothetical protein EDC90_1006163 [Martelella mediterranea]|jgi:hypothetical protein|uniref:Uncharacterized protein n=2 Tax=Martelella mediterranea TaxID=293089 RepID=A0A4R3P323_9HYPH|nr:hypothetical protein Mame_05038 [Martelella mediterranea DSM 17316]TCT41905.1 hypothetical protein EDC90_1006163 [Martelella mediterranea]